MAKKRSGGGSGLGLIVTLVLFILATVSLGVTTYMGFSEIEKEKGDAKKAKDELAKAEAERDWWRFQAWHGREYTGHPTTDAEIDKDRRTILMQNKQQFDAGSLAYAKGRPGEAGFREFVKKMDKDMPWKVPAELSPPKTYETRLAAEKKRYDELADQVDRLEKAKTAAEEEARKNKADLLTAQAAFDKAVKDAQAKATEDLKGDRDKIVSLQGKWDDENKAKNAEKVARKDVEDHRTKLEGEIRKRDAKITELTNDKRDIATDREKYKSENEQLRDLAKGDVDRLLKKRKLEAKEREELRNWPQDRLSWQVIRLDQKGNRPYINLGSAQGLKPQMTFSVHALDRNGRLIEAPKGSLEVVQVLGPNLSRTRITSRSDPVNDPIVPGDRLFTAGWSPGRPKRVAIAGLVDLGGEGVDGAEEIRRVLRRQGVIVDAYIDVRADKAPELKNGDGGKGELTDKTDYLIIGQSLEGLKHPRAKDPEYKKAFDALKASLTAAGKTHGVTEMSVKKYLDLIGYKATTRGEDEDR